MAGELIAIGLFLSIVIGIIFGCLISLIQRRRQTKNAVKKIKKQKMKYRIGGKEVDFPGKVDKELKVDIPSVPSKAIKIPKPTKTKSKIKKKIKKRKYLSTLKSYQRKKVKKK